MSTHHPAADARTIGILGDPSRSPARGMARVAGWGHAVPSRRVPNADFEATLDTSDEWITSRTGIRERRIAADDETTLPMATSAARQALASAEVAATSVDMVVVATCTAEQPMPSTASQVAGALGCSAGAFDVDAACAGFVHALTAASSVLDCGFANRVLVIGADTMSRAVDTTDRSTVVLFGDGAAALVLDAVHPVPRRRPPTTAQSDRADKQLPGKTPGLIAVDFVTDGDGAGLLHIDAGGAARPLTAATVNSRERYIQMDGPGLFHRVVRAVASSVARTLDRAGVAADDVAWFVPHQANIRIIEAVAARSGIQMSNVAANGDHFGNTSAASIPLLLAELADADRIADGSLMLMSGFGAGLSVATALWRWEHA